MRFDLSNLNLATAENLGVLYKLAKFNQDAVCKNEIATLESVLELAPDNAALKAYIATLQTGVQNNHATNQKSIDAAMKAKATQLNIAPTKAIVLSAEEKAASKIFPSTTPKVKETGYGVMRTVSKELMQKYGFDKRGSVNHGGEIAKLTVGGKNSILDIKKMLDAQFPNPDSIQVITQYLAMLKEAGLVTY